MDVNGAIRPRFKSSVVPISSDDGLFLLTEGRHAWMPDPIYAALAPILDGAHDIEEIFEALSERFPVAQVFAALDCLRMDGYLTEDTAAEARPTKGFWEQIGVPPRWRERVSTSRRCQRLHSAKLISPPWEICSGARRSGSFMRAMSLSSLPMTTCDRSLRRGMLSH